MLKKIAACKWREVLKQKKEFPLQKVVERLDLSPPPRDFKKALKKKPGQVNVIAEIKMASPSHGFFSSIFSGARALENMVRLYEEAGASAISVVTEKNFFAGNPEHLKRVKEAAGIPVLRKDFIVDEYQIYESRVLGADAVLLITSLLAPPELKSFIQLVRELGMEALVEISKKEEIPRAVEMGAEIIGINNRNLYTLEVDLERTLTWGAEVPRDRILVSESGIYCRQQVELLIERAGIDAILVGTGLMTSADPAGKIRELMGENVLCSG